MSAGALGGVAVLRVRLRGGISLGPGALMARAMNPLMPPPTLLAKLAALVSNARTAPEGGQINMLAHDPEVAEWLAVMRQRTDGPF